MDGRLAVMENPEWYFPWGQVVKIVSLDSDKRQIFVWRNIHDSPIYSDKEKKQMYDKASELGLAWKE